MKKRSLAIVLATIFSTAMILSGCGKTDAEVESTVSESTEAAVATPAPEALAKKPEQTPMPTATPEVVVSDTGDVGGTPDASPELGKESPASKAPTATPEATKSASDSKNSNASDSKNSGSNDGNSASSVTNSTSNSTPENAISNSQNAIRNEETETPKNESKDDNSELKQKPAPAPEPKPEPTPEPKPAACSHSSVHDESTGNTTESLGGGCSAAYQTYDIVCNDCGATLGSGEKSMGETHDNVKVSDGKGATCEEDGYEAVYSCSCGGSGESGGGSIPASGHSYKDQCVGVSEDGMQAEWESVCVHCGDVGSTWYE